MVRGTKSRVPSNSQVLHSTGYAHERPTSPDKKCFVKNSARHSSGAMDKLSRRHNNLLSDDNDECSQSSDTTLPFAMNDEEKVTVMHQSTTSSQIKPISTTSNTFMNMMLDNDVLRGIMSCTGSAQYSSLPVPSHDHSAADLSEDVWSTLPYSEKCQSCTESLVLVEHSGVLRCANTNCIASGRRINIVDGDMACLPFGADSMYKSMSLVRDDLQLCQADRMFPSSCNEMGIQLPGNTSLFNSLQRGCASSTNGVSFDSSSSNVTSKMSSDGSYALSSNDPHFKHLCIVFGYAPSNRITHNAENGSLESSSVSGQLNSDISAAFERPTPSLVLYIQACLCKTLCTKNDKVGSHPVSECHWTKLESGLLFTELTHVISRLAKDSSDISWYKLSKNPAHLKTLMTHVVGFTPQPPTQAELSRACQYFMIARRYKMDEFVHAEQHVGHDLQPKQKPFKAGFVWSKIWQMISPHSKAWHFFASPSNMLRVKSLDAWWKRLCIRHGWTYYATIPPRLQSKIYVSLASAEETDDLLLANTTSAMRM